MPPRPHVLVNMAVTADGKIDTVERRGALIEGRLASGRMAQPDKIGIVSRIGLSGERDALPEPSRFLADGGGRVVVCTTSRTEARTVAWLEDRGVRVLVHDGHRVRLTEALAFLARSGIERLMVEGGSTLVAGLLADGLVDELRLCVAPVIFGGETAPTPVGGPGWAADAAIALSLVEAAPAADGSMNLRYRLSEGNAA